MQCSRECGCALAAPRSAAWLGFLAASKLGGLPVASSQRHIRAESAPCAGPCRDRSEKLGTRDGFEVETVIEGHRERDGWDVRVHTQRGMHKRARPCPLAAPISLLPYECEQGLGDGAGRTGDVPQSPQLTGACPWWYPDKRVFGEREKLRCPRPGWTGLGGNAFLACCRCSPRHAVIVASGFLQLRGGFAAGADGVFCRASAGRLQRCPLSTADSSQCKASCFLVL